MCNTGLIKILVFLTVFSSLTGYAQSDNYVRTWTATAPVTDAGNLVALPLSGVKQTTQYADGLGRPVQTVLMGGSIVTGNVAGPKDMVGTSEYDAFGRETYKRLPFASTGYIGAYKTDAASQRNTFMQAQYGTASGQNETFFYGKVDFEASPLNRPIKSFPAGNSWVGAGKGTGTKYWLNTGDDDVKEWSVSESGAVGTFGTYSTSVSYAAGKLYKGVTVDENGRQVQEFTDKDGRVILKKIQNTASADLSNSGSGYTGWLCTYYLYDDIGNLRCVVQPGGVEALAGNGWDLSDATVLSEQCFRYEYDASKRMVMKKVPGAGKTFMVYDARDRLVMTQDANMRTSGNWLVTVYDGLNRPAKTGMLADATTFADQLLAANGSGSYPASIGDMLTETHYDDYVGAPNGLNAGFSYGPSGVWYTYLDPTDNNNFPYPQLAGSQIGSAKGLVSWSRTKVLGTANFLASTFVYDTRGRLVQVNNKNFTGGTDVRTTEYSWGGQPLMTILKEENVHGGTTETVTTVTKLVYDNLNRVVQTQEKLASSSVNGGTMSAYLTLSSMEYDAQGQLKKKTLEPAYSNNAGLDYSVYDYNIRGWLLGVNRTYLQDVSTADPTQGDGENFTTPLPAPSAGHYFGFDLGYDKDGKIGSYANHQLNGNIGGTVWKSAHDGQIRKYDFTYDAVNRLNGADFNQYSTTGVFDKLTGVDFSVTGLVYDANGNILHMDQKGLKANSPAFVDQLRYNYVSGSNRLLSVTDFSNDAGSALGDFKTIATHPDYAAKSALTASSSQAAFDAVTDYGYDENGNLKSDANKGISGITYNYLNLPEQVSVPNKGIIVYKYDASGKKLQKVTTEGSSITTTTYINGSVYQNDVLLFIGTGEGRVRPNATSTGFVFDYYLKDHLGNTRMTISEDPSISRHILDATSYYPFGLTMAGISSKAAGSLENRFKYNGNELQHNEFSDGSGLETMDFNARTFDLQIGRFSQLDPYSEQMRGWSPYSYCFDNPVRFSDPDGTKPGDRFNSIIDAVKDFGRIYNSLSIVHKRETASTVYVFKDNDQTYYSYVEPDQRGTEASSSPRYWAIPPGTNYVATMHTHSNYSPKYRSNLFSKDDREGADKLKVPIYVATPDGSLKMYDPATKETSTVSTDMPSDKNDPERKNNINPSFPSELPSHEPQIPGTAPAPPVSPTPLVPITLGPTPSSSATPSQPTIQPVMVADPRKKD